MNEKIEKALKDVREKTEDTIVRVGQFIQKHPVIASVISTTAGALVTGAIAYKVGSNDGRETNNRKWLSVWLNPLLDEHIESITMYDKNGDMVWTVPDDKYEGTNMDVKEATKFSFAAGQFRLKPNEAVTIMRVNNDLLIKK